MIEGPKWCGKTRTAMERSRSKLFMNDPDEFARNMKALETKPSSLLVGDVPRLLDEWQIAPLLWDAVRFEVDMRQEFGQFILTGSAVPPEGSTHHTGTGRISRMLMRPMSLFESGESTGAVSLARFFADEAEQCAQTELSIDDLAYLIVRGGWPASIGLNEADASDVAADYVDAVTKQDITRVDGVLRSPSKAQVLMRSLSRNVSTECSIMTISKDMAGDDETTSLPTVSAYIDALRKIFVVEDLPAWNPSIRSKTPIRSTPKRFFVDPSIAAASLRLGSASLMGDFLYFGQLFESLCLRDVRVYADAIDADVFHYRDKTGLEVDFVVVGRDGSWGAFEVKMGEMRSDEAADNLLKLKGRVDASKTGEPSFLGILTAGNHAYKRDDGVHVVPIGCLGP